MLPSRMKCKDSGKQGFKLYSGQSEKEAAEDKDEMEGSPPGVSKVIILPGNGCVPVRSCNWYYWLQKELSSALDVPVILQDMPDPYVARESVWIPFIVSELGCDSNSIVVGHSSGAEAIMRLLETQRVKGAVLVSACVTDLGCENERASGYYSRPWGWDKVKENCDWVIQMGSKDDPFIPWTEMTTVAESLDAELHTFNDQGHFMTPSFPYLRDTILKKLGGDVF